MHDTLLEQWRRENEADALPPSVLRQCIIGAIRGGMLGIGLVAIVTALAWLEFH